MPTTCSQDAQTNESVDDPGGEKPTLGQLRSRLAQFEMAFQQCSFIDSWPAAQRCYAENRQYIDAIKAEIKRREAEL